MLRIALQILYADKGKYIGLVAGIVFATLLMSQQVSIFFGLLSRTAAQIGDVREASLWVMDPRVQYMEEFEPMRDIELSKVRSVPGVLWATPYYKGFAVVNTFISQSQQVFLMGVDDVSLIPYPNNMIVGKWTDLMQPESMVMDKNGWQFLFPGEPIKVPREIEINDRRVLIVGVCEVSAPFMTFPIVFTRYSEALKLAPQKRNSLSFILVREQPGENISMVQKRITEQTGLQTLTNQEFKRRTINHILTRTGIPINFGITVTLGFIVGAAITGQTFYIFVLDKLRQYAALKAIGVSNGQIIRMVLSQAAIVGFVGYSLGVGFTAVFFNSMADNPAFKGFYFLWEVMLGTGVAVAIIIVSTCLFSLRRVLVVDPAVVFRG
jgi:putative ABC transport system permease protein